MRLAPDEQLWKVHDSFNSVFLYFSFSVERKPAFLTLHLELIVYEPMATGDNEVGGYKCSCAGQFPSLLMNRVLAKYLHSPNTIERIVVNNVNLFELELRLHELLIVRLDAVFFIYWLLELEFLHSLNMVGFLHLQKGRNRFQVLPFRATSLAFFISFGYDSFFFPILPYTLCAPEYFLV